MADRQTDRGVRRLPPASSTESELKGLLGHEFWAFELSYGPGSGERAFVRMMAMRLE